MRNGNSYFLLCFSRFRLRSYRTYEEWKPLSGIWTFTFVNTGSYRTYEEWKPFSKQRK